MDEQEQLQVRPAVILFYGDDGEIHLQTQGRSFTPQEIASMCEVSRAKVEHLILMRMLEAEQERPRLVQPVHGRLS